MTLQDFISKWNNRGIDFDGAFGDQCMDLMHQYCVEVLGVADGRTLAAPGAKDVYLNFDQMFNHELFDQIANTPTNVPEAGDIVLWGTEIGPFGHVAVFVDGDSNAFNSFDQNWPAGSKCHLQNHIYKGVLGWLHFKQQTDKVQELLDQLDKTRLERDHNWNLYQTEQQAKIGLEDSLANANKLLGQRNTEIEDLIKKVDEANAVIASHPEALQKLRDELNIECQTKINALTPPDPIDSLSWIQLLTRAINKFFGGK